MIVVVVSAGVVLVELLDDTVVIVVEGTGASGAEVTGATAGNTSPVRPAPAGDGPTPPSINTPHVAVATATSTVLIPPSRTRIPTA